MKGIFFFILASSLLTLSCNNNNKKEASTNSDAKGTVDPGKIQDETEKIEKQKNELEKLTPLSPDALKAMIPDSLLGVEIKNKEASSAMGTEMAFGKYELNDSSNISLSVYDCAGPGGAGFYSMQYQGMLGSNQDDDRGYTRIIDFNGDKAIEHSDKTTGESSFTYFSNGRFMVMLAGEKTGADVLKQAAMGLTIK